MLTMNYDMLDDEHFEKRNEPVFNLLPINIDSFDMSNTQRVFFEVDHLIGMQICS